MTSDELLKQLADDAEVERNGRVPRVRKPRKPKRVAPHQPFPVGLLPPPLAEFVAAAAKSIGCDESYIALPALATCASCIGNAVRFAVKADWVEPSMLWTAIVGKPGDKKTPAIAAATAPLLPMQDELREQYLQDLAEYQKQEQVYKNALKKWQKNPDGEPPLFVESVAEPRLWTSDATVEGLAMLLENNPKGVMWKSDELTQWLRGFGEYKGRNNPDMQRWLSVFNSQPFTTDRKTSKPIHVRRPNVLIVGGIQPSLFRSFFGSGEYLGAGLLQRFIFAWPPSEPAMLSKRGIGEAEKESYAAMLKRLQQLPYNGEPAELPLSESAWNMLEAWHRWVEFDYKPAADPVLYEVSSKLVAMSVRLGGILAIVMDEYTMEVSAEAMRLGVTLSRWFLDEWERAHSLQSENLETAADRELAAYIQDKHDGAVSPADLARARRDIDDSDDAERWLLRLASAGWGKFGIRKQDDQPGPNPRVFVVNSEFLSQR